MIQQPDQPPEQPVRLVEDIGIGLDGWSGELPGGTNACVVTPSRADDQDIRDAVIDGLTDIGHPYPGERLIPT